MNNNTKKTKRARERGLGKGLSALMSDVAPATQYDGDDPTPKSPKTPKSEPKEASSASSAAQYLPIDQIERNPAQPRTYFDPAKLDDLTRSIETKGVLQPILVRSYETKSAKSGIRYQIVAGERRYQAALRAGLTQIPAMVRELSDQEVLEIGVVENVQRANLNPIEEAQAYKTLMEEFNRRQEDVAQAVGKSRSHVANMIRLLTLPGRTQDLLASGRLTAGHARAIISAPDPLALSEMIAEKDLSVRETERLVRQLKKGAPLRPQADVKDADTRAVEKGLTEKLGMRVDLKHKGPGGRLTIKYSTPDQLEDLIARLPKGWD